MNLMHMRVQTSTELEQILYQQGFLSPYFPASVSFQDFDEEWLAKEFALQVYNRANEDLEDGFWALAPSARSSEILHGAGDSVLMVSLQNCLPCPSPNISLEEIISLKTDHEDELRRFHHRIDTFWNSVCAGEDIETAHTRQAAEIQCCMDDIADLLTKKKFPFGFVGLDISLAFPTAVIAEMLGASPTTAFLIGCVGISVSRSVAKKGTNKFPTNFEYVLRGLKNGLLSVDPDFPLDHDDISVSMRNITARLSYPPPLTPPMVLTNCSISNSVFM